MVKKVLAGALIASQLVAAAASAAPVRPQPVSFTGSPRLAAPAVAPARVSRPLQGQTDSVLGSLLVPVIIGGVITLVVIFAVVINKDNPSTVR